MRWSRSFAISWIARLAGNERARAVLIEIEQEAAGLLKHLCAFILRTSRSA
jgi:hypothetical protein